MNVESTNSGKERSKKLAPLIVVFLVSLSASNAHAYLDPATGTLIIQAIGAAIAGAVLTLKMNWLKVKAYFRQGADESESNSDRETCSQDSAEE